jgi:uncharacterized protein (TIGR00106 family)
MSVLMEFAMFPTDKGASVSEYVSKVIDMIRKNAKNYKLTAMGTIIETDTMQEALEIIQKANDILTENSERVYSSITFDIQKNKNNRLQGKIQSIENRIGSVNK